MNSRVLYAGDGSLRLFAVPFPYLSTTHVKVLLNKIPLNHPLDYRWVGNAVELTKAPAPNDAVQLVRVTPADGALVQFQNGAVLTEQELNTAIKQMLYLLQETRDSYDEVFGSGVRRIAGPDGIIGGTAEDVINAVVQDVLNDELTAHLQASIGDIELNAQELVAQRIRIDDVETLVNSLSGMEGDIGTLILEEKNERIAGDTAIVETIDLIGAKSGDGLSFLLDLAKVLVSPTESLGTRLTALQSVMDENKALIVTEQTTRATEDSALATRLDALLARVGDAEALIATEQTTRASEDSAMAQQLTNVNARVDDTDALIATEQTARADADVALAYRLDIVEASTDNAFAQIGAEQTARADADSALTQQVNQALSRVGNAEALILEEQSTRADADSAATLRMNGMQSQIDGTQATILEEQETRADADSALAMQVTTLQTDVNGNRASIETHQETIDGLAAQYSVKLDVNGHVAGFGLWNEGGSARFTVLADKFAIVTPGQNPVVPFVADAGGVYMDTAYVRHLVVDKITGGNINHEWGINDANGRIVLRTATHMKVIGVGFGVNGDLMEWFGPLMAINQCSKANAVTYTTTDGDAYWGGSLSAGVLKNAAQSTQVSKTATVSTGNFGSNGNPRVVVASFSFGHSGSVSGNVMSSYPTNLSVVLTLRRGTTVIGSQTIYGQYVAWDYDAETNRTYIRAEFTGSFTVTDNTGGTTCEYNATLSGATGQWPITLSFSSGAGQNLSIVSTEE